MKYKLGKAPAKRDIRTARIEPFMLDLPAPPPHSAGHNRQLMADCGMLGNDRYGDCVVADDGHRLALWTKLTTLPGDDLSILADEAINFYQMASLALNHSSADAGLVMLDYNKWRMQTPWKSRSFYGFGTVDHFNHTAIKQLVIAFDAVALGVLLPITAQSQAAPGGTWSLVSRSGQGAPGTWGGHDVPAIDYDEGGIYVLTWGGVQYLTWDFFDYYVDECYAIIPTDKVPGFDLKGFVGYLQSIGAYVGPVPVDPPTPPAPPAPKSITMLVDVQPSPAIVGIKASPFSVRLFMPNGSVNADDNSTVVTAQLVGFSNRQIATAQQGVVRFSGDTFTKPHDSCVYQFTSPGFASIISDPFSVTVPYTPPPPPPAPPADKVVDGIGLHFTTGETQQVWP